MPTFLFRIGRIKLQGIHIWRLNLKFRLHRILVYPGFSLVGHHCRVIGFYHHFQLCHDYQTYLVKESMDSYYKLICETSFHVRCLKTLTLQVGIWAISQVGCVRLVDRSQGSMIHTSSHQPLASKEIVFTRQQKYVTSQINKDTNSYYITPICIYVFGNNKGNFIISPISFSFTVFQKTEVLKLEDGLLELNMYQYIIS